MKRDKRQVYLELSALCGAALCCWCRYGKLEGSSLCDESAYYECHHPLDYRLDELSVGVPDENCWAFSPQWSVAVIADIIGIVLANEWKEWGFQWGPDKGDLIEVSGFKELR